MKLNIKLKGYLKLNYEVTNPLSRASREQIYNSEICHKNLKEGKT